MGETVLVTGGCGFIGRHVCRALVERGHRVRVLDAFIQQVHGRHGRHRALGFDAEIIFGDVRDSEMVRRSLGGVDAVIHLAAEVGVGQSMYEIGRYVSANDFGTAVLLEAISRLPVRRVVVASSMSIYGEGLYRAPNGSVVHDATRDPQPDRWDPVATDGSPLKPLATPESKLPALSSVYALSKHMQERLTLMICAAYGVEGCALRLFNVFGPGQALSNPYTGVLAIFASRLFNRQRPLVFEDGMQLRDFVHVSDVAAAFLLALERPEAAGRVFNVGSGVERNIVSVARALAEAMGVPEIEPEVLGKARSGDIRHCFADISLAKQLLGYAPAGRFGAQSLGELAEWVARRGASDHVDRAYDELQSRGLVQ